MEARKLLKYNLPEFSRQRKIWKENVEKLIDIVSEYKTAMEYNDNAELLDYAEQLHSQYEKLVRIVRPVLKELSDFHETLYPLYHYYLPENNVEKIHNAVKILQEKMLALNNATLSERWKKKEADFIESRKNFLMQCRCLQICFHQMIQRKSLSG